MFLSCIAYLKKTPEYLKITISYSEKWIWLTKAMTIDIRITTTDGRGLCVHLIIIVSQFSMLSHTKQCMSVPEHKASIHTDILSLLMMSLRVRLDWNIKNIACANIVTHTYLSRTEYTYISCNVYNHITRLPQSVMWLEFGVGAHKNNNSNQQ